MDKNIQQNQKRKRETERNVMLLSGRAGTGKTSMVSQE